MIFQNQQWPGPQTCNSASNKEHHGPTSEYDSVYSEPELDDSGFESEDSDTPQKEDSPHFLPMKRIKREIETITISDDEDETIENKVEKAENIHDQRFVNQLMVSSVCY